MYWLTDDKTLRPLFRTVFGLGDSTDNPSANPEWPANGVRAYRNCESDVELQPTTFRADKVSALATVKAKRNSDVSESASEEHILGHSGRIQVSRSVLQDISYK